MSIATEILRIVAMLGIAAIFSAALCLAVGVPLSLHAQRRGGPPTRPGDSSGAM